MDGQASLWNAADACLEDFLNQLRQQGEANPLVDILDILHASAYVWRAAKVFHRHREHQEAFAQERLLRILRGEVSGVVKGLRRMATVADRPRSRADAHRSSRTPGDTPSAPGRATASHDVQRALRRNGDRSDEPPDSGIGRPAGIAAPRLVLR